MKKNIITFTLMFTLLNCNLFAGFIINKGQWDNSVLFLYQTGGLNAWITVNGIVFDNFIFDKTFKQNLTSVSYNDLNSIEIGKIKGTVTKLIFDNCNKNPLAEGINQKSYHYNYFIGKDEKKWAAEVPVFEECLIKNIYNGIDLKFREDDHKLRYDFIVSENSNPLNIKFFIEGAESNFIDNAGELNIMTSLGLIKHKSLNVWQMKGKSQQKISADFLKSSENSYSFIIAKYDSCKTLIIDPLVFSTFTGGSAQDEILDVNSDNSGNTYVCGYTASVDFPTSSSGYDKTFNSVCDVVVSKFNSSGTNLIYSTYIGGDNDDKAFALDVDVSGNAFITGYTASSSYPVTTGSYDQTHNGEFDAFVTKLNAAGSSLVYSTFIGGFMYDEAKGIKIDGSGNSYICGKTYSSDFPTSTGAFKEDFIGGQDIFALKLNSTGRNLIYSTYLGGTDIDVSHGIAIDNTLNAYILGETYSSDFTSTSGAYNQSFNGDRDVTLTKLNSSASIVVFSTFLGASQTDIGHDIILDNSNNAIICGETNSPSFPTTPEAYDPGYNGGTDGFLTKFNNSGSAVIYSTYIGGTGEDKLIGLVSDTEGKIYCSGSSQSPAFPTTPNALYTTNSGLSDAVVIKLNSSAASIEYSTYFGGSSSDEAYSIDLDNSKNVCFVGYTQSTDFPHNSGAFDESQNGMLDGFISKISGLDIPIITTNPISGDFCPGSNIQISYDLSSDFNSGNIFTAQLSDIMGGFSSPTDIGTLSSNSAGTIIATIPKNTTHGSKYRIRVVASDPQSIGSNNGDDITINSLPAVSITGDSEPCVGEVSQYSNFQELNMSYLWRVIGGTILNDSTSFNVRIDWETAGTGYLTLIKKNMQTLCTDTAIIQVDIKSAPETSIGFGKYEVCVGETVEYSATSSTIASNEWLVIGGVKLEGSGVGKVIVRWTSPGEGSVEMIKTNEFGCKGSDLKKVTVNPLPVADLTGPSNVTSGKSSIYKTNNTALTGFRWSSTGGIIQGDSTADSVTVLWGAEGLGLVRLVKFFTQTDCSDTNEKFITINKSIPYGEIAGKDKVCAYSIENYSTDKVDSTFIKWNVLGGNIIGANNTFNVEVNWQNEGAGSIKYIISDSKSGNKDSLSKSITINPVPVLTFGGLNDICENSSPFELITAQPAGGTYSGNGIESGYFYPDRAGAGDHILTYSYTDNNSCTNSITTNITVYPKPEKPLISKQGNILVSNYKSGNQWFNNTVKIEGETNDTFQIAGPGNYSVQVTDSNGCVSDQSESLIVVVLESDPNNNIEIYPNPVNDVLFVQINGLDIPLSIAINDILGKEIYKIINNNHYDLSAVQINTSNLNCGIYILNIYFSNKTVFKKLIINR